MLSETQDVNIFSIRQEDKTLGILLSSKKFFLMHQLLEMTTFLSLSPLHYSLWDKWRKSQD